jgi:hypothetical protein
MLELVVAAFALARPNVCVFPPGQPAQCGNPGPGSPTGPPPPVQVPAAQGPPTYQPVLLLPRRIHTDARVQIWARDETAGTLCEAVGSSRIGCASSNVGSFWIVVRSGVRETITFREGNEVVDRRVYRNGKLVARR